MIEVFTDNNSDIYLVIDQDDDNAIYMDESKLNDNLIWSRDYLLEMAGEIGEPVVVDRAAMRLLDVETPAIKLNRKAVERVLKQAGSRAGSLDWSVYVDMYGDIGMRHNTEPSQGWYLVLRCCDLVNVVQDVDTLVHSWNIEVYDNGIVQSFGFRLV